MVIALDVLWKLGISFCLLSDFVGAKFLAQGVSCGNVDSEFIRFMMNYVNRYRRDTRDRIPRRHIRCMRKGNVMILMQDKWYAQLVD